LRCAKRISTFLRSFLDCSNSGVPFKTVFCKGERQPPERVHESPAPRRDPYQHLRPTDEGWLYLAVVLDLFTRKIVGWAMRGHMRAELTIAALTMAIQRQKAPQGLIHHSDRGSQYAAAGYRRVLGAAGMIQSMSRKGNCWDNAPMESCFGTLQTKLVHQACYPTRDAARHWLASAMGLIRPNWQTPASAARSLILRRWHAMRAREDAMVVGDILRQRSGSGPAAFFGFLP
jgi:transposase InsO family protein